MPRKAAEKAPASSLAHELFTHLYYSPAPLTKQEAARELGVSLPTMYQAFNKLDELGLLAPGEERGSTGGRRAATFAIDREHHAAAGIFLTGTSLKYACCNLFGERIEGLAGEEPLETPCSAAMLANRIGTLAQKLQQRAQTQKIELLGVGLAVPSAIDPKTGLLQNTKVARIADETVAAQSLINNIALPAAVFNDADSGAFAQLFPAHRESTLVYLSLERGVGGSVLIGGQALHGDRGLAAEFGHICIEPGGKRCACGKRGCLEAYCSTAALSEELGLSLDEFFYRADHNSEAALAVLDVYIDHLARGIQTIRAVLDCQVALGGTLSSYLGPYFSKIDTRVNELDPFMTQRAPFVSIANHPFHGVAFGAAEQMIERYIEEL